MAVESRIDADDEWFVGEDRVLRFTFVEGDLTDLAEWAMSFTLYPRRAKLDADPLLTAPAVGYAAVPGAPAHARVSIDGTASAALEPGIYQFVLARADVGARQILSFGPAEIRRALNA